MTAVRLAAVHERISDILFHHAEAGPDSMAVVDGDIRLSYDALRQTVERYAKALVSAGVSKGDRVATLAPPSADYWIQFLAATSIGGIWLGLNPRYRIRDYEYVVGHARPKVVFTVSPFDGRQYDRELQGIANSDTRFVTNGSPAAGASGIEEFLSDGETVRDKELDETRRSVTGDDIAAICYTSGTTGRPKGAMLSQAAIVRCAAVCDSWMGDALEGVVMGAPINHVGALCNLSMNVFFHGGKIVFLRKVDMEDFLRLGEREQTTLLPLGHVVFGMLLSCPTFGFDRMRNGRLLIHGGSKTTVQMLKQFSVMPARIASVYGQTETTGIVTFTRPDELLETHANTLGKAAPGVELRLVDPDSEALVTRTDSVGELQVRCDFLFSGYFQDGEASARAMTPDGFLRTGDLCIRRTDGNYELVDRKKLMFKSGGYNVYPAEIEQAIGEHPGVREVVVVPMPDDLYSEVGCAFLTRMPESEVSKDAIRRFLRKRIANYKIPKRFEFLERLPTLANLKHDRGALQVKLNELLATSGDGPPAGKG